MPHHPESPHIRAFYMKVRLSEIMTRDVIFLFDDDPFSLVEEKLRENRIRHLPVVDFQKKLVGLITQRDLYRIHSPRKDEDGNWYYDKESLNEHVLKEAMTKTPVALSPDDFLGTAILIMVDNKYGCIPIIDDDGKLVGIVTQHDMLKIPAEILRGYGK